MKLYKSCLIVLLCSVGFLIPCLANGQSTTIYQEELTTERVKDLELEFLSILKELREYKLVPDSEKSKEDVIRERDLLERLNHILFLLQSRVDFQSLVEDLQIEFQDSECL